MFWKKKQAVPGTSRFCTIFKNHVAIEGNAYIMDAKGI
jgi:hypothetical protein